MVLRSSTAAVIMLRYLVLLVLAALPPSVRSVSVKRRLVEVEPPKKGGKEVIDHVVEVDEGESALLQAATFPISGQLESMSWSRRGKEIFRCWVLRTFSFS